MMITRRYWIVMVAGLIGMLMGPRVEAAPVITAKNGILYQDGKPCFLVGIWDDHHYDDGALSVNYPYCKGGLDIVSGRNGNCAKISFENMEKPAGRWVDFNGIDPSAWVGKYKALKMWVKGDGSSNTVRLKVEYWDGSKSPFATEIGGFSLQDKDWKEVVIPLEPHYLDLAKANSCCFIIGRTEKAFSFMVDDITLAGDTGEEVLGDFDFKKEFAYRYCRAWNRLDEREKFKTDPVYQALRDDPLYREISADSLGTIGINSVHLEGLPKEHVKDIIPMPIGSGNSIMGRRSIHGEGFLCEQLQGMPLVPGFVLDWGYNGGPPLEEMIRKLGLPPTILQRYPNGYATGGMMTLCFEDPLGNKVCKELWQRGVRYLIEHGGNPYAYEMINENSGFYICACRQNKDIFIGRLKEKYKDIATLNKTWGTEYSSFEAILAQIPKLGDGRERIKGLSVAWEKFMEDRYVEMLHQGGEWIHAVEDEFKRPHGLIGQMGYPTWDLMGFGGTDMYKLARGLDVIETEGGVAFGGGTDTGLVDPLNAVMMSKGVYAHQMALDLADAASGDKPIINTENYIIRKRGNVREPTTRGDIITSLWEEFLRGAGATHTYSWSVKYLSREAALAEGIRNQQLLSPYVYPRDALNGFKDVQEEIRRVAEVVMERPRLGRNAESAVLFSRPTARYLIGAPGWQADWKKHHKFFRSHETFYTYMLENHYPMRYLYEEQLPEEKANKFRVIFAPHSDNIYPETLKYLTDYVSKGGTLVCFGDAFRYDEYGNDRDQASSKLLGLERRKVNGFEETVELKGFGKIKIGSEREVLPSTGQVLLGFPASAKPFVVCNQYGAGRVYYVNTDMYQLDTDFEPMLGYLAQQVALQAPLAPVGLDGARQRAIEADLVEKGDRKLIFLVNWTADQDRVIKLKVSGLDDRKKYYLADIAKNCLYTKNGEKSFPGRELKDGINLLLPGQERVVLLLTKKRYSTTNQPLELLSDSAALETDKKIKDKLVREAAQKVKERAQCRELVFGVAGISTYGSVSNEGRFNDLKECMLSAAGGAVAEIKLLTVNSSCDVRSYGLREGADSVITYQLTYKDTLKEGEIEQVQEKIIEALVAKCKIKLIKRYSNESAFWKAQEYKEAEKCAPLDIRRQANMGFADEKGDDRIGGLFDEGRSLKNLPVGKQKFAGVPFDIIDPAQNNGKACIVLKGQAKPYFPDKAEGIEVKRKVKNIYILHNACYCGDEGTVYRLRLNYSDGSKADLEIRAGQEIKDWFNPDLLKFNLPNAKVGWQGKAVEKSMDGEKEHDVALYCAKLVNPNPEKEVATMDIISADGKAVPAIFAVSVTEN